ncbi:SPOR domain-containing protein [candidate division KSB1 bacterium]|nr:SPOR domain-containing protein [candidate division KSB1 bacterium]
MNEAIGIVINDNEVKVAHLAKRQGRLSIISLKSQLLHAPLRQAPVDTGTMDDQNQIQDIFLDDEYQPRTSQSIRNQSREGKEKKNEESARDRFYSFLNLFPLSKAKLGINIDPALVTYTYLDNDYGLEGPKLRKWIKQTLEDKQKRKIDDDNFDFVSYENGKVVSFLYDSSSALLESLEELRAFKGDKLYFGVMETNEIALVNLIRNNYHLGDSEISAVIYIENGLSRIVFMRGRALLHCSVMINEGSQSSNILEIIYSKILYEQDQNDIPELTNIFMAGKCARLSAHTFFKAKFPKVRIDYLYSAKIESYMAIDKEKNEFSEYAIPISLAWKTLDPGNRHLSKSNLLPAEILDRQKVLKLAYHGYILLGLIAIAAFFFTWTITTQKGQINSLKRRRLFINSELSKMQENINKVHDHQLEITKLKRNMALVDSLGSGYNSLVGFLVNLNEEIKNNGNIWLQELHDKDNGYFIRGLSLNSNKISQLSYNLGNVNLNTVRHRQLQGKKVFEFECEKQVLTHEKTVVFGDLKMPENFAIEYMKTHEPIYGGTANESTNQITQTPLAAQTNNQQVIANNMSSPQTNIPERVPDQVIVNKPAQEMVHFNDPKPAIKPAISQSQEIAQTESNKIVINEDPPVADYDSPVTDGACSIFLSSHISLVSAKADLRRLEENGIHASLKQQYSASNGMTMYRIIVGNFQSYDEAVKWAQNNQRVIGRNYKVIMSDGANNTSDFAQGASASNNMNDEIAVSDTPVQIPERVQANITPQESAENYQTENSTIDIPDEYGEYTIFVSSHISQLSAEQDVRELAAKGFEARISRHPGSNGMTWYYVYLGRFQTQAEAISKIEELIPVVGKRFRVRQLQGTY